MRPVSPRPVLVLAAAAVLAAVPVLLALRSPHLAGAAVLLVVSTATAAAAVAVLAVQPFTARLRPRRRPGGGARPWTHPHVLLGLTATALVLVHLGALVLLSPDDALYAMSLDGPTRARMALLATVLLLAVTLLGVLRRRLRWSGPTWRLLHGALAGMAVALGVGHAVLTDGALEGPGTVVLLVLGAAGTGGAVARVVGSLRRATPGDPVRR